MMSRGVLTSVISRGVLTSECGGRVRTTTAVLAGRAITSEVSQGLTCIGDAVSTGSEGSGSGPNLVFTGECFWTNLGKNFVFLGRSEVANWIDEIDASGSSSTVDSGSATTPAGSAASTSTNFAPMLTQAPILAVGAAAVFAYGAM